MITVQTFVFKEINSEDCTRLDGFRNWTEWHVRKKIEHLKVFIKYYSKLPEQN